MPLFHPALFWLRKDPRAFLADFSSPFQGKPPHSNSPRSLFCFNLRDPLKETHHSCQVSAPNASGEATHGGHKGETGRQKNQSTRRCIFYPFCQEKIKLSQESTGGEGGNLFLPQILTVFRLRNHRQMGFSCSASPSSNFLMFEKRK